MTAAAVAVEAAVEHRPEKSDWKCEAVDSVAAQQLNAEIAEHLLRLQPQEHTGRVLAAAEVRPAMQTEADEAERRFAAAAAAAAARMEQSRPLLDRE